MLKYFSKKGVKILLNIIKGFGAIFITAGLIYAIDLGIGLDSGQPITKSIWNKLTTQLEINTDKNIVQDTSISSLSTQINNLQGKISDLETQNNNQQVQIENLSSNKASLSNVYNKTEVDNKMKSLNGIVREKARKTVNSSDWSEWTISGLIVGKPVIVGLYAKNNSNSIVYIHAIYGSTIGATYNHDNSRFFVLAGRADYWGTSPSAVLVPSRTSIKLMVRGHKSGWGGELYAYQ